MGKITREYLEKISFMIELAKIDDFRGGEFFWHETHEGRDFWIDANNKRTGGKIPAEAQAIINEMIRVWNGGEPQPEPAIEYVVTAGPGRMLDLGVTTEEMSFLPTAITHVDDNGNVTGGAFASVHIAPTTKACMTGK